MLDRNDRTNQYRRTTGYGSKTFQPSFDTDSAAVATDYSTGRERTIISENAGGVGLISETPAEINR